jgi:hypothetical protein
VDAYRESFAAPLSFAHSFARCWDVCHPELPELPRLPKSGPIAKKAGKNRNKRLTKEVFSAMVFEVLQDFTAPEPPRLANLYSRQFS